MVWEWQHPLYAEERGDEFADDWYEALAVLLDERSPA
jgi:hypothetical protein